MPRVLRWYLIALVPLRLCIGNDGIVSQTIPSMQWIAVNPPLGSAPPALMDAAMAYDGISNKIVLFGGRSGAGVPSSQTFILDVQQMKWRTPNPIAGSVASSNSPPARSNMVCGVDSVTSYRNDFVIGYGLGATGPLSDVWAFNMNYELWAPVNISGTAPPPLMNAVGGIDPTYSNPLVQSSLLLLGMGNDGVKAYNDIYGLELQGTFSPNVVDVNGAWTKFSSTGNVPAGRFHGAGAIVSSSRIISFGGCGDLNCIDMFADSSTAAFPSNFQPGTPDANDVVTWSNMSICPAPQANSSMTLILNTANSAYRDLVIMLGSDVSPSFAADADGVVNVLNAATGIWSHIMPNSVNGALPSRRSHATLLALRGPLLATSQPASDIVVYGGMDSTGTALNDLWILRLYDEPATNNGTTFLSCPATPFPSSGSNTSTSVIPNYPSANTTSLPTSVASASHRHFSMLGFFVYTVAFLAHRFLSGSAMWKAVMGSCLVASYGLQSVGIVLIVRQGMNWNVHAEIGIAIVIGLYLVVPLELALCWKMQRRTRTIEQTTATFPVERVASRRSTWTSLFSRLGVTDESHASEKFSVMNRGAVEPRPSDGTLVDERKIQIREERSPRDIWSITSIYVLRLTQVIILLGFVYVALAASPRVSLVYLGLLIGYIGFYCASLVVLGYLGYPRRESWLVQVLQLVGGRGPDMVPALESSQARGSLQRSTMRTTPRHSSSELSSFAQQMISGWIDGSNAGDVCEDEEITETRMSARDVMVMTVPRRKLAVVNA